MDKSKEKIDIDSYKDLRIDCKKCFGFCCVALYFSAFEGFPSDKEAGKPCLNLNEDFSCKIHKDLRSKGLKGCTSYDCFGAGQKVAQNTYKGSSWRNHPESAKDMFDIFLIVKQLHEMQWYLTDALNKSSDKEIKSKITILINETKEMTFLRDDDLRSLDLESHRDRVNALLKKTSKEVRNNLLKGKENNVKQKRRIAGRLDLIGADLKKINVKGADLSGALLMAADLKNNELNCTDLIGADLRDADLRGANLTNTIYITQAQINTAKGDLSTKLPAHIIRPSYWTE
ncbi:pentapeptide repeat-containing protein [Clostridium sp. C8-1-8]|uniref:pentapeptide repeat-containing protein n=1 Tax=Clostridium sp. C8-1-8 TaxID=2698831 RepID=UPI00136ECF6B|nr:pentapeptide repeat-containing protein [Clostridium sp. C8-1-8]